MQTAPETHGARGIGYAELPAPRRPLSDRHAADLIIEEARRRPGELTLITIGPLTNLGLAVLREPELPRLLRRWVLMGGSYRSAGNTAPTTEWNIHCDPEAAKVAFTAFAKPGLAARPLALGLDVTERAKFTPEHMGRLARRSGSQPDETLGDGGRESSSIASNPIVRFTADALRFYMEFHSRYDGFYGAFIHDPLAVAAALDPSLVRAEARATFAGSTSIQEITRGAVEGYFASPLAVSGVSAQFSDITVSLSLSRAGPGGPPNLDVAVEANAEEFLDRFVERVGGLAERLVNVAS